MDHMKYAARIAGIADRLREAFAEMLKEEDRTARVCASGLVCGLVGWVTCQRENAEPIKWKPPGFEGGRLEEFERVTLVEFVEFADVMRTAYMNRKTEREAYRYALRAADGLTLAVKTWAHLFKA